MKKTFTLSLLLLAILCAGVQNVCAQKIVNGKLVVGGITYNSTGTCLWVTDSMYLTYVDNDVAKKFYLEKGKNSVFTVTKEMGLQTILSVAINDSLNAIVAKYDENGEFVKLSLAEVNAIKQLPVYSSSFKAGGGKDCLTGYLAEKKNDWASAAAFLSQAKAQKRNETVMISGGTYVWNAAYAGDVQTPDTLVISTPEMAYLADGGIGTSISEMSKGHVYPVIMPIVRSGYPYSSAKYKGDAKWSITDGDGTVIKEGTVTLKAENDSAEYVDTIAVIQDFIVKGDKATFTVTFSDNTTLTSVINTLAHEHSYASEFAYDETKHWHKANCSFADDCATATTTPEDHDFTENATSTFYYTCSTCQYVSPVRKETACNETSSKMKALIATTTEYQKVMPDPNDISDLKQETDNAQTVLDSYKDAEELINAYQMLQSAYSSARSATFTAITREYAELSMDLPDDPNAQFNETYAIVRQDYLADMIDEDVAVAQVKKAYEDALAAAAIESISVSADDVHVKKYLQNGTIIIENNGKKYNAAGQRVE